MRSFIQSFFTFRAFILLCCLVNSASSAPIGPSGSSVGFSKRHLSAVDRIFPYGKLSDRFLRVNDVSVDRYLQSLAPDASGGRSYIPQDRLPHPVTHPNKPTKYNHAQPCPNTLMKPTSSPTPVRPFIRWTTNILSFSTSMQAAAVEKMQMVTSHLRCAIFETSPAGCKEKECSSA
jgi:hypothetical protein